MKLERLSHAPRFLRESLKGAPDCSKFDVATLRSYTRKQTQLIDVSTTHYKERNQPNAKRKENQDISMGFEWDEEKRLRNIEKHGIDFIDAGLLFGNPYLVGPGNTVDGEQRWLATGTIDETYVTAVFTRRGPVIRIISMRRARHGERKRHQEIFGT